MQAQRKKMKGGSGYWRKNDIREKEKRHEGQKVLGVKEDRCMLPSTLIPGLTGTKV